jgi:5-methylcytosine-specific restriction protein A
VDAWRLTTDPTFLRRQVYKRDQGVCALCGLDTKKLESAISTIERTAKGVHAHRYPELLPAWKAILVALRIGTHRSSLWDADHKLEVVKGGGECGLDGMQTLCLWCHRAKTARLATELAAQRNSKQS